jgi:RNA polymerase sigma factor (sigma-70 family)
MGADSLARTVTRLVADGAADADLVRRFVAARDEAAFALLVRRHGPMVFGVCRRTLGHTHDAEDAFQAVFLVLARKAHAVRPEGVGRWLYGVAVRVANKARVRRARRIGTAAELPDVAAPPVPPPSDWLPLLDAALARLPDRDRNPILLCDLLGRSRAEAAAELGIAEGTLSSRLARARDRLRVRLARLGAALSVPVLATGLADQAGGTVPPSLLESTIGVGSSAGAARELADGVLRTMFLAKVLKLSALGVCLIGMAAAAVAWLPTAGADPATGGKDAPKGSPPVKEAPKAGSDLERIQGTWVVESVKTAAGARPDQLGMAMTFDGSRVEFAGFPGSSQTFLLDPASDPRRIDFQLRNARRTVSGKAIDRDLTLPSIYKFDRDKLHMVLGDDDLQERPDSFDGLGKNSPFTFLVLRRPTADERNRPARGEGDLLQGTWEALAETVAGEWQPAPRGVKLVVKGDRLRLDTPAGALHATYTLDLAATPWQIDLTATADWGKVKKDSPLPGLLARDGGRITLAIGVTKRPADFYGLTAEVPVYMFVREGASFSDHLGPKPGKDPDGAKSETTRLRQLQQERVKALEEQLQGQFERIKIGKDPLSHLLDAVRDLAEAELELADTKEARIAAVEKMLKHLVLIEEQLIQLQEAGLQTKQGIAQGRAARLKAEIELEKLKAGK